MEDAPPSTLLRPPPRTALETDDARDAGRALPTGIGGGAAASPVTDGARTASTDTPREEAVNARAAAREREAERPLSGGLKLLKADADADAVIGVNGWSLERENGNIL